MQQLKSGYTKNSESFLWIAKSELMRLTLCSTKNKILLISNMSIIEVLNQMQAPNFQNNKI